MDGHQEGADEGLILKDLRFIHWTTQSLRGPL
jgi:hypothetical protein